MIFYLYIWISFSVLAIESPWYMAQDMESFLRMLEQEQVKSRWDQNCQEERTRKSFPENCLFLINQDVIKPQSPWSHPAFFDEIKQLCSLSRSEDVLAEVQVQQLLELEVLPSSCRKSLEQRLGDIVYLKNHAIGPNFE